MSGALALFGELPGSPEPLAHEAHKHGWDLMTVHTADELHSLCEEVRVDAVLIHPSVAGGSWQAALKLVQDSAPGALPLICWSFRQYLPWGEMSEAGAFHFLHYPLRASEVRQALGFVWSAKHPRMVVTPGKAGRIHRVTASVA